MAQISVTLSDFEGHFCCLKSFTPIPQDYRSIAIVDCNFNCLIETEDFLKVTLQVVCRYIVKVVIFRKRCKIYVVTTD